MILTAEVSRLLITKMSRAAQKAYNLEMRLQAWAWRYKLCVRKTVQVQGIHHRSIAALALIHFHSCKNTLLLVQHISARILVSN